MRIFAIALIFNFFFLLTYAQEDYKQVRSAHFIINYNEEVKQSYVSKIKNTAEKFYRIITQEFNLIRDELWLWENRAKIFIAKDKEDYVKSFDCSSWSAACVNYQQKLIYTYPNQLRFKPIFVHELTHIIFREYVGESKFALWLDEGVATYMEDKYANSHYRDRLITIKKKIKDNSYIKLSQLDKITSQKLNSESKDYVDLFYVESFSIVRFIIKKYGAYRFRNFLSYLRKGNNVEKSLSRVFYDLKSLEDLEKKWKKFYQG